MIMESRIAFVGGGHMARALISGLLRAGYAPAQITVGEPREAARRELHADFGIEAHEDNRAAVRDASLIVLAVKPQDMPDVLAPLADGLSRARALVLSIAAGLPLDQLARWCGAAVTLVRAMPNRPALVGAGATGLYAPPQVGASERERAQAVMSTAGLVVWVDDESLMDAVTAVSGSGPAYFFLLAECLADAGVAQGLAPAAAEALARATLAGAGSMLTADARADLRSLRAAVTSRGGTTEAAVGALEAGKIRELMSSAVAAAVRRGRELGRAPGATGDAGSPSPSPSPLDSRH